MERGEEQEFFIEALTAERLVEKLQHFDDIGSYVFFKIPTSVTMDTVNMYPQPMFCKLFPELGEIEHEINAEQLAKLKEKSVLLLKALENRLNNY